MIIETKIPKQITTLNNIPSCHRTDDLSNISEIYRKQVNICIWQRILGRELTSSSEYILDSNPNIEFSEVLDTKNVVKSLKSFFGTSEKMLPFFKDVCNLVDTFSGLFHQEKVWLRLDGIDYPMCPRFHTDRLKCRLVTTYVGPSTEWIPHHLVNANKLGHGNEGKHDSESGLYQSENNIQQLDTGHVALLKGESWEGNEHAGIVHRSPNSGGSYKRLYLTIDFLETYLSIFGNSFGLKKT